ncbi:hypothetical protein OPS90_26060, partial [Escherichia coli]|nr:hypothetical protein [Escherichia coli]
LTFQNHTNCPLTDFGGKTSIFSHPVYLFLRKFSLQDFRGGSVAAGDRVNRQFVAERPDQLWVADFTYVSTWQGFVYVAFIIDVFAGYI